MWYRIENNKVIETTDIDPAGRFHPSMIWVTDDGSNAQVGWTYAAGVFTPPVTAALCAVQLKDTITQKRWQIETGGITLPSGVHIATGIDDQNRITSVIANARLAGLESVSFKAASGWVTLTLEQLEGVAAAIALHVQQCFSAERAHHEAIDALEQLHADDALACTQALQAYDVEGGWPSTATATAPA